MARFVLACILGLGALSLQPALGGLFPLGAAPDLVLAVACVYAVRLGGAAGVALGFGAGILHGSMVGKSIGAFCASRTLAGWFAVWAQRYLPREAAWSVALITWGATWAAEGAFALISPRVGFARWIGAVALGSLANALCAIPLALVVGALDRATTKGRRMGLGVLRAR